MVGQTYLFPIYKHIQYRVVLKLNIYTDNYFALCKYPIFIIHIKLTLKQIHLKNTSTLLITQSNGINTLKYS